ISLRVIRRTLKNAVHTPANELFDYTSGRWLVNDALRLSERRTIFNVSGLLLLAAQSVGRSPSDILSLTKLAEGGCNRCFLITMHDGFQMIARIPYPHNQPSHYLLASEVATMDYLRNVVGIPIPQVFGYAFGKDNAAETEYIFMEYVRGSELCDVSSGFRERDVVSVVRQLVQLEAKMMGIEFPAGGSLYYVRDLEQVGVKGIPMPDDPRFSVGPDMRQSLWYGRRESQTEVNRGPYETMAEALTIGAHKELAFLERFGQPLLPFDRSRREAYGDQEQQPSEHAENLNRYLLVTPSLIPQDSALGSFRIRHPDLTHEGNILVSRTTDSGQWKICSLIDWQYTSILPITLLAGIPDSMRTLDGDDDFNPKRRPSLPTDFSDLSETLQNREMEKLRRRLKHFQYLQSTKKLNPIHHAALMDPQMQLRQDLLDVSSAPWQGEPLPLKCLLIQATQEWDADAGPCPIEFEREDIAEADLWQKQQEAVALAKMLALTVVGFGPKDLVPNDLYEEILLQTKEIKETVLAYKKSEEERNGFLDRWIFQDMDEEPYM
ncbi:protein kinase subdomain-containing protein PKL/CAK/Fmp29, partial [Roridomyces roridus]